MKNLKECRNKIDEIDNKIVELFKERMKIIKDVALFKKANNLPIFDPQREMQMLNKRLEEFDDNDPIKKYYKTILESFLQVSKLYQKEIHDK